MTMLAQSFTKAILLRGCAPAALACAALSLPQPALAQAFGADPTVFQGNVTIDRSVPALDTITVVGNDAVIDWLIRLDPISGAPLTFLPDGHTGLFRGGPGEPGFAVLNRVFGQTGDPIRFEGLVRSVLRDGQGNITGPGGFVAFYSPTGIVVGSTGRFDIGQLLLTSHFVDVDSFTQFYTNSGPLLLSGDNGPQVLIEDGARIEALAEGSYFIAAAPQVRMAGEAHVNGSVVYLASYEAELRHSSGLFDIVVPLGTEARGAIIHTGSTGGPASTGAGDEHVIYGVVHGIDGGSPVSMLFSGNLGFEPAASVSVVNGDIILSANHDVFGRTVNGGENRQGAASVFDGGISAIDARADIVIDGVTATSNLLALASHDVAISGDSTYESDLVAVGHHQALLTADTDQSIRIGGDLFLSADNYGNRFGSPPEHAFGGLASLTALEDASITVAGRTRISAKGVAQTDSTSQLVGQGQGGEARVSADGGSITLAGNVFVVADALTNRSGSFSDTGTMDAGFATVEARNGGSLLAEGDLTITASALTPQLSLDASLASPGDALGGSALLSANAADLQINGAVHLEASGLVGARLGGTGNGGTGSGGFAVISISDGATLALGSGSAGADTQVLTRAQGGSTTGPGSGGMAEMGRVRISVFDASASFTNSLIARAEATGGAGANGGDAIAVEAGASLFLLNGDATIGNRLTLFSQANGGDGRGTGSGGDAQSGEVLIDALEGSSLTVAREVELHTLAFGGSAQDGPGGAARTGLMRVGLFNASRAELQLDSAFATTLDLRSAATGGSSSTDLGGEARATNTEILLSDDSELEIANSLVVDLRGRGGDGDLGGAGVAGQVQLLIGSPASFGPDASRLSLARGSLAAIGIGGAGVSDAGAGNGGTLLVDLPSGELAFTAALELQSLGLGGASLNGAGGAGTGGAASLLSSGGTVLGGSGLLALIANGTGGNSGSATFSGGTGQGGLASLASENGAPIALRTAVVGAEGFGGTSASPTGAEGLGGAARVLLTGTGSPPNLPGLAVADGLAVLANGHGGAGGALLAGRGVGGEARLDLNELARAELAGPISFRASGFGGSNSSGGGGAAQGGNALATLDRTSRLITGAGALELRAEAIGNNGGNLDSAAVAGGNAVFEVIGSAQAQLGGDLLVSAGASGGSATGGALGNPAQGGGAAVDVAGSGSGLAIAGSLLIDARASGGTGAAASGGDAALTLADGADLSAGGLASITADGLGGSIALPGFGNEGIGGTALVDLVNATATFNGGLGITADGVGGNGRAGGLGQGGGAELLLDAGALLTLRGGAARLSAIGRGGNGQSPGGPAQGGEAYALLADDSILDGDANWGVELLAGAIGGGASNGTSGDALGGEALLELATGGSLSAGAVLLSATASAESSELGGTLTGGGATLRASEADLLFLALDLDTSAQSSVSGDTGLTSGGSASIDLSATSMAGDSLRISTNAISATGDAAGGSASVFASNASLLDVGLFDINSTALAPLGSGAGGQAAVRLGGTGPTSQLLGTTLRVDAGHAGSAAGQAGLFELDPGHGLIRADIIDLRAPGTQGNANPSRITASQGLIRVHDLLRVDMAGDLLVSHAAGGGIVGDGSAATPALVADFDLAVAGLLEITGDGAAGPALRADTITLTSNDLAISPQAQVIAPEIRLNALPTASRAVIGGSSSTPGYTLTSGELARLFGERLTITLPVSGGPAPDAELRSFALPGTLSAGGGFAEVSITSLGSMAIVGAVRLEGAAASDRLSLTAGTHLHLDTGADRGSIRLLDAASPVPGLSGQLTLTAPRIIMAPATLAATILADPGDPAIPPALAQASGQSGPDPYILARGVTLRGADYVLGNNRGFNAIKSGITVSDGGLAIVATGPASAPLRVIVYGSRQTASGEVINDLFFDEVVAGGTLSGPFTADSTLNDCIINQGAGSCGTPPPPPPPPPLSRLSESGPSQSEVKDPVAHGDRARADFDPSFGNAFPNLVDAPLIIRQEMVDEPVTSGTESVSGLTAASGEDDEEAAESGPEAETGQENANAR